MPKVKRKRIVTSESDSESEVSKVNSVVQPAGKRKKREEHFDILLSKLQEIEREIRTNINSDESNSSSEESYKTQDGEQNQSGGKEQNILEVLGANPSCDKFFGEALHEEVAVRWENYVTKGVNKSTVEELIKKYPPPSNCKSLQPPKLNSEIEICLSRDAKKQDHFLTQLQTQVASALAATGHLISKSITDSEVVDSSEILSKLADNGQTLCEVFYQLSQHRRFLIKPFLREDKRQIVHECPIDEYLFGKKLQQSIQSNNAITKTGRELKVQTPYKSPGYRKQISTLEPQPGPSGLQIRAEKPRNLGYLNSRRPQSNAKKKTTRRYNNSSSHYRQQERKYNFRK